MSKESDKNNKFTPSFQTFKKSEEFKEFKLEGIEEENKEDNKEDNKKEIFKKK